MLTLYCLQHCVLVYLCVHVLLHEPLTAARSEPKGLTMQREELNTEWFLCRVDELN